MTLLKMYSFQEIITFIVLLALAIKGCVSFFDWFNEHMKKVVDRVQEPERLKDHLYDHEEQIKMLKKSIEQINKMVNVLIASDMDDIKAFITREHHYFVFQKGWIDDYSLDCIEKRYVHYQKEGGNSFIGNFMDDLRKLPKNPPETTT